jgi:hypothetical protein
VKRLPRHSAGVTADRVEDALARWGDQFTEAEKDSAAVVMARLNQIAEGDKR